MATDTMKIDALYEAAQKAAYPEDAHWQDAEFLDRMTAWREAQWPFHQEADPQSVMAIIECCRAADAFLLAQANNTEDAWLRAGELRAAIEKVEAL